MLTLVMTGLGAVVIVMSRTESPRMLAAMLTLTRGLGESSLSVLSMALVGKWFSRRLSAAMGIYSVLIAFGFVAAITVTGQWIELFGWREGWQSLGIAVLGSGIVVGLLLVRNGPKDSAIGRREFSLDSIDGESPDRDFSFLEALSTPAFWCFAVGAPIFGMAFSAVSLFNESLLVEQGFDHHAGMELLAIVAGSGVLCNLLGGWLGMKISPGEIARCDAVAVGRQPGTVSRSPLASRAGRLRDHNRRNRRRGDGRLLFRLGTAFWAIAFGADSRRGANLLGVGFRHRPAFAGPMP